MKNAVSLPQNPTGRRKSEVPIDIPRDQWDRPLIAPPESNGEWCKPVGLTRASTLGECLEDSYNLGKWRMGVVVVGMGRRPDLVLSAKTLTMAPHDKQRRLQVADKAFEAGEGSSASEVGTALHAVCDLVDRGQAVPDLGVEYNPTVGAYRHVTSHFQHHEIERFVVNWELQAAGTFDRLTSPLGWMQVPFDDSLVELWLGPNDRFIWDLKTSQASDFFGLKFMVQFAVYAGGQMYRHLDSRSVGRGKQIEVRGEYLDWPDGIVPSQDWALICHAPSGGDTCDLHWVPLREGQEAALEAVKVRKMRKGKYIVPAALPVAQRTDQGQERLIEQDLLDLIALTKEDEVDPEQFFTALWEENQDIWTEACDEAVITKLREFLFDKVRTAQSVKELELLWRDNDAIWTGEHHMLAAEIVTQFEMYADQNVVEAAVQEYFNQPAKLSLIKKIHDAQSESDLDMVITQYEGSSVWDKDCTYMVSAVRRRLNGAR